MPRYNDPYIKRTTSGSDGELPATLVELGRKLLGYLADMIRLGAPTTMTRTAIRPEGRVTASMKDGQPIVDIVPNKNVLTTALQCSLQLVSGLLDINTGIVYFGDTTKCSFGALYTLELNGSQFIAKGCIRNKPGKDQHDDAANVLTAIDTDPVLTCTITDKANAQIELPASLWSGLTRRWMQAMYGTPLARYKLADIEPGAADFRTRQLLLPFADGTTTDDVWKFGYMERNWLFASGDFATRQCVLVDVGRYNFRFLEIDRDQVKVRKVTMNSCAKRMVQALKMASLSEQKRRMILSFILAAVAPLSAVAQTITLSDISDILAGNATGSGTDPYYNNFVGYGWHQNEKGDSLSGVLIDRRDINVAGRAKGQLCTMKFSLDVSGDVKVTTTFGDAKEFFKVDGMVPTLIPYERNNKMIGTNIYDTIASPIDKSDFDAPIYCWYDSDDTLVVVNYKLVSDSTGSEAFFDCASSGWNLSSSWANAYCETETVGSSCEGCKSHINGSTRSVTYGFYLSYYSGVAVSERYIENHTGGNTLATVRTAASADTSILSDDQTDATYSSTVDDTNFTGFPSDGSPSNCDGSVYVPGELLSRTCAAHDETDGVAPSCTPTLVFDGPCDNGVGPYSFSHTTTAAEHAHRVKYLHKRGTNDRGRLWDSSLVIPHGSVTGAYFGEMRENTDSVGSSEQTTSNCSDAAWAAWAGGAGGVTCAVNVSREDYAVWCYQQAACTGPDPGDVYKVQVYRMDCPGALTWPTDDPSLFGFNGYGSDQVRLDTTVSATASRQTKDMNFSLTLNGVATQVAVLNGKVTTSSSNAGNLGTYVPACQPYFPSIDTSGNDPYTGQYPVGTDHICRLFASAGGVDVHQVSMLPAPTVFDSTDLNFGSYDNSAAHSGSFIPSFVGFA